MTNPSIKYNMLKSKYFGEESLECQDSKCPKMINNGDTIFYVNIHLTEQQIYCENCGLSELYTRKKKEQRIVTGIPEKEIIGLNEP